MVRWFNYTSSVFWVLFLFLVLQLPKGIVAEENIMIDDKSIVYPDPTELYKSSISYTSYRRTGLHDGNLIKTAYSNFGNIGSRPLDIRLEWPKGSGTNYGYEFIFYVAAEVIDVYGDTIHVISENYTGGPRDIAPDASHTYGWEPLPGYFNDGSYIGGISEDLNNNGELDLGEDVDGNGKLTLDLYNELEYPAMSHLLQTWPTDWPEGSYPGTIGSRKSLWNGEYGTYVRADQESYYVMDDRSNDEFLYYPFISNPEDTLSWPDGRRGLGCEVETRNYMWADVMAEDIMISIYQVKNISEKDLPTCIVGMYVDADVGTSGSYGDATDDDSYFDTLDDITYQWDLDGLSARGKLTGYFGFAFLQSPGLGNDGIDNDEDGITDESQENGIDDDLDWRSFDDENGNGVWDWEDLNNNGKLDEGEDLNGDGVLDIEDLRDDVGVDGLGPLDMEWPGLGVDPLEGNGQPDVPEPNFEYTDNTEIDQIGLTSFFGTRASVVLSDDESSWYTKIFPGVFTPPTGGIDVAFHYGCGFFHLNRMSTERFAIACILGNDFDDLLRNKRTMQEIYDHDYNFKKPPLEPTIVSAIPGDQRVTLIWDDRAEKSRDPVYQQDFGLYKVYRSTDPAFSDIKTITDAFGNALLWEPIVQFDYADGLTGAHPIAIGETGAHYDMGSDTGLRHSYIDTTVENGRTYFYAVASVDKGYDTNFYEDGISPYPDLLPTWPSECNKNIQTDVAGNVVALGRNCAVVVPKAPAAGHDYPSIDGGVEHSAGIGSGTVKVSVLVPDNIKDDHDYKITFTDTTEERRTNSYTVTDVTDAGNPQVLYAGPPDFNPAAMDRIILDGFIVDITNDSIAEPAEWGWKRGKSTLVGYVDPDPGKHFLALPNDFEIRIIGANADTSFSPVPSWRVPVDFQVWNTTTNEKAQFILTEFGVKDSSLTHKDFITIITNVKGPLYSPTWKVTFKFPALAGEVLPEPGDVFYFTTYKPFTSDDVFEFSTSGWGYTVDKAKNDLEDVCVVPDPYVSVNSVEKPSYNIRGRGERRVDFIHLPMVCTIKIYTINGKLVDTIEHNSPHDDGAEPWLLTTKDGLDVAWGTYFFHVEAPGVGQKVGKFAIIR